MPDEGLINALINRITANTCTTDAGDQVVIIDELNSMTLRQDELNTEIVEIKKEIEDLSSHVVLTQIANCKYKLQRLKSSLKRCKRRECTLQLTKESNELSTKKSLEFINRLRCEKQLQLPVNDIAYAISSHAVLRYIQRYGCDVSHLILTDISRILSNVIEVELKPVHKITELLNHNCVTAKFFKTKDDIGMVFVVINCVIITTYKDDYNKFERVL